MLTEREYKITLKLLRTKNPIKIKDMADEFLVSPRMIKYNLENVKYWFHIKNMEIQSRPNKGIWIECEEIKRKMMVRELIGNASFYHNPDQNFRMKKILMMLLLSDDYLTASDLSKALSVSRNTILKDIKIADEFLHPLGLKVKRKKGSGYILAGDELHQRILLEQLIYSNMTPYEKFEIISSISKQKEPQNLTISLHGALCAHFRYVIEKCREIYDPETFNVFSEKDLITLLLRITISMTRMNVGKTFHSYRVIHENQPFNRPQSLALSLLKNVCGPFQFPLLEDEFLYVIGKYSSEKRPVDLIEMTQGLIRVVGEMEGLDFFRDIELFKNLYDHLSLRIQKGMYLTEINPFTDEIKTNHPRLFASVKKACEQYLEIEKIVNKDEFISYIALYFLTSLEKTGKNKGKVRALYVCSTGNGIARVIKNRVEKEVAEIKVVSYCSIMEVDEICEEKEIDLIISVFPVHSQIPTVVVEAIPTQDDIEALKKVVNKIIAKKPIFEIAQSKDYKDVPYKDLGNISQEIILKGFEIVQRINFYFPERVREERKQGLLLHILLMVNRCYFNKQYDEFMYRPNDLKGQDEKDVAVLKSILEKHHLKVHESELIALLQYFKGTGRNPK